jgi:hypothetical protein
MWYAHLSTARLEALKKVIEGIRAEVERVESKHQELQQKYALFMSRIERLPLIHVIGTGSFEPVANRDLSKKLPTRLSLTCVASLHIVRWPN